MTTSPFRVKARDRCPGCGKPEATQEDVELGNELKTSPEEDAFLCWKPFNDQAECMALTFQDAVREGRSRDAWFRPVSWRGSGRALALWSDGAGQPGDIEVMQPSGDIDRGIVLDEADVLGPWEALVPADVLKERS